MAQRQNDTVRHFGTVCHFGTEGHFGTGKKYLSFIFFLILFKVFRKNNCFWSFVVLISSV